MEVAQQHLILRITQFGLNNDKFGLEQMYTALGITDNIEKNYVRNSLISVQAEASQNPNHILVAVHTVETVEGIPKHKLYSLLPQAFFNYVDYLEIVEARKNADTAKANAIVANGQSKRAIWLSVLAILISAALGAIQILLQAIPLFRTSPPVLDI